MRTIDELGVSDTPWERTDNHPRIVWNGENLPLVTGIKPADARLIAAAPDCYEALAAVVSWYERNKPLPYEENGIQMIMDYAKKALAKASGEEVK